MRWGPPTAARLPPIQELPATLVREGAPVRGTPFAWVTRSGVPQWTWRPPVRHGHTVKTSARRRCVGFQPVGRTSTGLAPPVVGAPTDASPRAWRTFPLCRPPSPPSGRARVAWRVRVEHASATAAAATSCVVRDTGRARGFAPVTDGNATTVAPPHAHERGRRHAVGSRRRRGAGRRSGDRGSRESRRRTPRRWAVEAAASPPAGACRRRGGGGQV
ncbi:hypothetical protein BU14_0071s0016 [Porphyra umbilicalis]|uniref:Uncharacterized protein n=1 Tax=Porphyra umbilicalis TaxID=2786 RepID=A0A1X6PFX8_PORUM|nr:hypothetical protein BU14_0071s0016 [Porphyra umbilicalis]|eukprot:OSX79762.1 hypothetical protein BU14_0071s0016 [Porphyra umbilicalis]